ncbi:MAG: HAD family hydrolase [Gammaproteobacteria bacterium]
MTEDEHPVVVFDLDGTITRRDTYVPFLLYSLYKQPLKILRLPVLAIDVLRHKIGSQSNSWLKTRFLRAFLAGQKRSVIDSWAEAFSQRTFKKGLHLDAMSSIQRHLQQGHELVLLSASLDIYVEPLGKLLGFKHIICTRTTWENDLLGDELDGGNCYGEIKVQKLKQWLGQRDDKCVSMAYADHESDFSLLEIAQRGVVINPGKKLRELAISEQFEVAEWN